MPKSLLNFGISRIEAGDPQEAIPLLQRALRVLDLHKSTETEFEAGIRARAVTQLKRAREYLSRDPDNSHRMANTIKAKSVDNTRLEL